MSTRIVVEKKIIEAIFYKDYASEQEYVQAAQNVVARDLEQMGLTPSCNILNCLVLTDFVIRNLNTIFEAVDKQRVK